MKSNWLKTLVLCVNIAVGFSHIYFMTKNIILGNHEAFAGYLNCFIWFGMYLIVSARPERTKQYYVLHDLVYYTHQYMKKCCKCPLTNSIEEVCDKENIYLFDSDERKPIPKVKRKDIDKILNSIIKSDEGKNI